MIRIGCAERDGILIEHPDRRVCSTLTNFVGGEVLNPSLPHHTATEWETEGGKPLIREYLDEDGCRHYDIRGGAS